MRHCLASFLIALALTGMCAAQDGKPKLDSLIGKSAYACADSPVYKIAHHEGRVVQGDTFKLLLPQIKMKIEEAVIDRETDNEYALLLLLRFPNADAGGFVLWTKMKKSDAKLSGEPLRKAVLGDLAEPKFDGPTLVHRGMEPDAVRCLKGWPDQTIRSSQGEAWIYENQHTTIYFYDGTVSEVVQTDGF
jgi:hypothetical protein